MDRGGGDDDDNDDDAVVNNFMYESTLQLRKSMYDDLLSHYTYYRERESHCTYLDHQFPIGLHSSQW